MSIDAIDKYLEEIRKRLIVLNGNSFCGKILVEVNMKFGGITEVKYSPTESIKI